MTPFFDDFRLEPSRLKPDDIKLEWRRKNSDQYFDSASFSDGTLRFIALHALPSAEEFTLSRSLSTNLNSACTPSRSGCSLPSFDRPRRTAGRLSPPSLPCFSIISIPKTYLLRIARGATQIERLEPARLKELARRLQPRPALGEKTNSRDDHVRSEDVTSLVHVEGQTEEGFVNEVLRDHFVDFGYNRSAQGSLATLGCARARRDPALAPVRKDIVNHLRQDPVHRHDYGGFLWVTPKREVVRGQDVRQRLGTSSKATRVEEALLESLAEMGAGFDGRRFIPFVVMHEFEGLLFSNCAAFDMALARRVGARLQTDRDSFGTPEDIMTHLDLSIQAC